MFTLRDYQQEASDAAVEFFKDKSKDNGIIISPTGCHEKGYKIIMADGTTKNVEDVEVGDSIMGVRGVRKVLSLHRGTDMMYRITPKSGEPFIVNGGHILSLYKTNRGGNKGGYGIDEISVSDYIGKSKTYKHIHKLRRHGLVDFGNSPELPLDPYFVGLILGDGCVRTSVNVTTRHEEVKRYIYDYAGKNGWEVREESKRDDSIAHTYYIKSSKQSGKSVLRQTLEDIGIFGKLAGEKTIPQSYLTASVRDRLRLLAGFIDTDTYYHNELCEYCTKSYVMARQVQFLCRSLGFMCNFGKTKVVNGESYYRMCITGDLNTIPNLVSSRRGHFRQQKKNFLVTGFNVEPIGNGEYYGFTLDGDHLYCDWQFFIHHNSGKSIIIADIAQRLDDNVLVFQPNKEILLQNHAKYTAYGFEAGIYSASCNKRDIKKVTFATIGSVKSNKELFKGFKYIIIDECHVVNPKDGMYKEFFKVVKARVLGLTATPYRLMSFQIKHTKDEDGKELRYPQFESKSMLEFLTKMKPCVFKKVIYAIQIKRLVNKGYLASLEYFDIPLIDPSLIKRNSNGSDYDEEDARRLLTFFNMRDYLVNIVERLKRPKSGIPRNGILVFTQSKSDAEHLCRMVEGCEFLTSDMTQKQRDSVIRRFRDGEIRVLAQVNILTCGFDYPALDTVVLARPTMSLAFYYQAVGRIIRPYGDKKGWVVDLCGTIPKFGKVEDLFFYSPEGCDMFCGKVDGKTKKLTNRFI